MIKKERVKREYEIACESMNDLLNNLGIEGIKPKQIVFCCLSVLFDYALRLAPNKRELFDVVAHTMMTANRSSMNKEMEEDLDTNEWGIQEVPTNGQVH